MIEELAPIVLFAYNRPEHLRKTIEALLKNDLASESELFIFSDAAKNEEQKSNVELVREYINTIKGFKRIYICCQEQNKGLAQSIIDGVTDVIERYRRVIVLEDDLITSPMFLRFMNDALTVYEKNNKIWSVSGYTPPIRIREDYKDNIYLSYRGSSWGWATWSDRWQKTDWSMKDYQTNRLNPIRMKRLARGGNNLLKMMNDCLKGKNHSWAVRWCYSQAMLDMYTIYPIHSLIMNTGTDGSGTNYDSVEMRYYNDIDLSFSYKLPQVVSTDRRILASFKHFYDRSIIRFLKRRLFWKNT